MRKVSECALAALLFLQSCSIKEERDGCPCWLTFDLSGIDAGALIGSGASKSYWSVIWDGGEDDGMGTLDGMLESLVVTVPRSGIAASFCFGAFDVAVPEHGLKIIEGCDCPPLFSFSCEADAGVEECVIPVILHKNYCVLDISLDDLYRSGAEYVIRGAVSGYDSSWRPALGTFSYTLLPDESGHCSVSLPRQADGSLKLCVFRYGELEKIFALGDYIIESGYDWEVPDLEDISLEIDYTGSSASFKIDQWKKTLAFTVVI